MPLRRVAVLAAATLALIVAATWLVAVREPRSDPEERPLLAGLSGIVVDTIQIVGAGDRPLTTLRHDSSGWRVAERAGFPADAARIGRLLEALRSLASEEPKTRDPASHAVLGVEDLKRADAQGLRIELTGGDAHYSLIVGRNAGRGLYVRRSGDPQAHLAVPAFELEGEPSAWLDRRLLDVKPARIASIEVEPASGPRYRIERGAPADAHFRFAALPRGRELYEPTIGDPQAALLEAFTIDDVVEAPRPDPGSRMQRARVTTFDGLRIDLAAGRVGDRTVLTVSAGAAGDADAAVRAEAHRIESRARGRWFEVGAHRHDSLFKPLDAFLK